MEFGKGGFTKLNSFGGIDMREQLLIITLNVCLEKSDACNNTVCKRVKCPGAGPDCRCRARQPPAQGTEGSSTRARQPPPLLMGSATSSADTRCSALAGWCQAARRAPGRWSGETLRYTVSRVPTLVSRQRQ